MATRTIWMTEKDAGGAQIRIHLNAYSDDWGAYLWADESDTEYIHLRHGAATLAGSVHAFRQLQSLLDEVLSHASVDASALPRGSS